MPIEIGAHLHDRYRITAVIAHGGMGSIYRAHDESLNVDVAIKENSITNEDGSRQFHREATLLAGLRHPNLPRVTDHFVIPAEGQYLVMDFIEGKDLREMLSHQIISEQEAIEIGMVVCSALVYLHSRTPPVIHRDIKPGNIKITPSGQVFLVDFGLAKAATPGQATATGAQALTPGYAPPEQYGQGTTPSSDLYALGATLYAILTGKIPEDSLARAVGSTELTPLRVHNPQISEALARVIEQAMAIRPQDRFPTAGGFHLALQTLSTTANQPAQIQQQGQPQAILPQSPTLPSNLATSQIPANDTPPPVAARALPQRRLPMAGILLGSILLVILSMVGILVFSNFSVQPPLTPTTVQPTTPPLTATKSPVTPTPLLPTMTLPIPSATLASVVLPSATPTQAATAIGGGKGQIAFVSFRAGDLPQIFLMNAEGTNPTQLTKLPNGACQPHWSPDGKRLVFISPCRSRQNEYPGSALYLINADGTGLVPLPSMPGGDFDPAWSPDGNRIAFTSLRENIPHIFLLSLAENRVTRISAESSSDGNPVWSPDGKSILFESTRLGSLQIWWMESSGQNAKMISVQSLTPAFSPGWSPDGQSIIYNRDQALPNLYIRQNKDLAPEVKLTEAIKPAANASFSPDGKWIIFESWSNNNHDIFRMAANGSVLTRLTQDPAVDFSPAWRP